MTRPDFLKYTVSGKLVRLLGSDSVSTDTAALFELVKNSYDADASKVLLSFHNISIVDSAEKALEQRSENLMSSYRQKNPSLSMSEIIDLVKKDEHYLKQLEHLQNLEKNTKIIIEDNGIGMTVERLETKWMVVGVDKEDHEIITKKGRRTVGQKGVGRFSAEKIAHNMTIVSSPIDSGTQITAEFNWDEFAKRGLTDVKIPIKYGRKDSQKHGLRIELTHLRERWNTKKINNFLKEVSQLVVPREVDSAHPFSILVKKDGRSETTEIESGLLKKAPYHFIAELTPESKIRFINAKYKHDVIIPNKNDLDLYGLKEISDFTRDRQSDIAKCGPARLVFYGYPFDPSGRPLGWTEYYGKIDTRDFQRLVEEKSGVKIYRDGFRIRPYGDKEQDWLRLGEEARSVAGRLPSQNIIGWIEITADNNKNIIDTTTREKIIENDAFSDLRSFANQAIELYSKYAEAKRQEKLEIEKKEQAPKLIKQLGERIIDNPSINQTTKKQIVSALNEIQTELTLSDTKYMIEKESLMDEINALRNLASLGITAGVVSHETNDFLRDIRSHSMLLKDELEKPNPDKQKMLVNMQIIDPSIDNLLRYMMLIRGFTATFASREKGFRKKSNLDIRKEVDIITHGLRGILNESQIIVENNISRSLPELRMFKADLQSTVINLFSNSIKSLRHLVDERKNLPNSKKNRIRISGTRSGNEIIITFSDNGLGIPYSDREHVFDLFWSRTTSRDSAKSGSGLGLSIVKEIVKDYGGDIFIEKHAELGSGVTFKIVFPRKDIEA